MGRRNLKELLESGGPGELLLLGKGDAFTFEEIERFCRRQGFEIVREFSPAVVAVLEGRRLSMPEELLSEQAYAEGIALYRLEDLERIMSEAIRPEELLMALKLGDDMERLLRLLGNPHLEDGLFLRLLELYTWEGEELMESDRDRRVLHAMMERFLELDPYERDALHSPATLLRLIRSTDNPDLMEALLRLPPFEFRGRRGMRLSIAEAVASREILKESTVRKLLKMREEGVRLILAANPALKGPWQRRLLESGGEEISEALALNPALDEELFADLLKMGGEVTEKLLRHQSIRPERWRLIVEHFAEEGVPEFLGENPGLCTKAAEAMIERGGPGPRRALAANEYLPEELLERLAEDRELWPLLAGNPAISEDLLRRLYREEESLKEILAANPSTPTELLKELFESGEFRYHQALAANPSTPMAILHQLKTDHRLWLILQKNETFVQEANREMGMR
ncbi:hypothetical protein [Nitratifractor salsuginis]|uniref:Leucine rich repeat variant n=1 Tax=Nitratifractor salsuginis (strain DSM 16511 / JCM 12458 / E9I37-1) TaxID=749222 RepID=E6WZF2_NITSE|nr:hypothetical protein [Nitratifractor salsuginis]ADV45532.1 hypothetical protein Nitsa_0261 [Nitratifractor salsuginis DSM 16511]